MTRIDLSPASARRALAGIVPDELSDYAVVDRFARIVWGALCEPGDAIVGRLVASAGAAAALRSFHEGTLRVAADITARELAEGMKRWMPRAGAPSLEHALELARLRGVRHLAPGDDDWPSAVDDLGDSAPLGLWARGRTGLLRGGHPGVALVGARASTSYGEHVAIELAADLSGDGVTIVSGAAYGIDGAAHRAALSAGGSTVALLASGVDRPYPAGHAHLIDRIATEGVVLSEALCGGAPTKWRFLARNRLIAALSDATVVVEAGWRSGSLNTAGHAASLGRGLGAVPGPVTSGASAGCHRLLREFDAVCVTSAADVRELLPLSVGVSVGVSAGGISATRAPASLATLDLRPFTDDASRVRDAMSVRSWRDALDVAVRSGMAPHEVEAQLGLMLLAGEVEQRDGRWRRVGASRATSAGGSVAR